MDLVRVLTYVSSLFAVVFIANLNQNHEPKYFSKVSNLNLRDLGIRPTKVLE